MDTTPGDLANHQFDLPRLGPWSALSDQGAADLSFAASVDRFGRRDHIALRVGIVLSGVVGLVREASDGRRVVSSLFHAGDLVDLRRSRRRLQGQLVALTSVRFLRFEETRFESCKRSHPEIADAIIAQLREHLSRMGDHCTDLACKTPIERLASALLEFRGWPEVHPPTGGQDLIRLPLQRGDVADYIGVRSETLSRTMRQLEREQAITLSREDLIDLVDVPKLRMIANGGRPRRSTRRY